jgi:hypothetical protein
MPLDDSEDLLPEPNNHDHEAVALNTVFELSPSLPTPESQGRKSDKDLLALLLKDKDDNFRARVLELVTLLGIYPSDPLFYVMISTGTLQTLLEDSPRELEYVFDRWIERLFERLDTANGEIEKRMESYGRAAVKMQQKEIAKGVNDVLNKTTLKQAQRSLPILIWAGGICVALLSVGVAIGWFVGVAKTERDYKVGGLDPHGERRLTKAELDSLHWATSPEGKFAKHLLEWNSEGLTNQGADCQQEVKTLGLVITRGGKHASEGFCPLWVVPPGQRKFEAGGTK